MPVLHTTHGALEYVWIDGRSDLAPLVYLHHGLGCVSTWRRFPYAVAEATGRPTLVYTRHGYGRSAPTELPRPADYMDREACEVLPEVLDRLGVRAPVLVGHSDGAAIALLHAARGRRPVTALALLGPLVFVEDRTLHAIRAVREAYESGAAAYASGAARAPGADGDAVLLRRKVAMFHEDPDAALHGWSDVWLSPTFRGWSIEDRLPRVTAPTLVMGGTADEFATPAQVAAIERGLAGPVRRVDLPDGDHLLLHSARLESRAALVDFLTGLDAPAGDARSARP
ncbi:alpha/beta fold hydrolase [Streptomyces sp. SAJ15]|uniref:alpha/beta fold hydrolase n=1 Tax=Streptomyces sp. SAJ15 TaxID=2011095 RepID=UPI001186F548|nr:alpha/beta hydrolase [Streptomyces sp. SAJ15]TVL87410.1 alpha/beta hydrolase [Streptomyces sp. SAJ15]